MEFNLSSTVNHFLTFFVLLLLPALLILIGAIITFQNAWFFITFITWFGVGLILYNSLR